MKDYPVTKEVRDMCWESSVIDNMRYPVSNQRDSICQGANGLVYWAIPRRFSRIKIVDYQLYHANLPQLLDLLGRLMDKR